MDDLTSVFRREMLSTGITAHTIEPGGFKTQVTDHKRLLNCVKNAFKRASPELQEVYGGTIASYREYIYICHVSPFKYN